MKVGINTNLFFSFTFFAFFRKKNLENLTLIEVCAFPTQTSGDEKCFSGLFSYFFFFFGANGPPGSSYGSCKESIFRSLNSERVFGHPAKPRFWIWPLTSLGVGGHFWRFFGALIWLEHAPSSEAVALWKHTFKEGSCSYLDSQMVHQTFSNKIG